MDCEENQPGMKSSRPPSSRLQRNLICLALFVACLSSSGALGQRLVLACAVVAQQQQDSSQPTQSREESQYSSAAEQTRGQTALPGETRISPKEAEELFRSVDDILKFASQETGLPIRHQVKRRLTSRDEVVKYLEKHMEEDKDSQRLKRSELVLKKFGLLPRNFDLHSFLISLLREQVAGYYDVKTKTVNLLDWVNAEQQKPVLAHELTHALQDQSYDLEKLMKPGEKDLAREKDNPTAQDIENDEAQTVRQAVVEGQAMAVLVDYMLAPTGQSITGSPEIVEALKQGMLVGTADSVQYQNAPVFLKELLTFPYRYGLDFVVEVLRKQGREKAFASILANPPRTTRQIMEPKTYLTGEVIEPVPMPDFARLMNDYNKFDVGSMSEFDVALLIDQYAGGDAAKSIYPEWRGGYYYAARPKGDPGAPLALLYVSRWTSAASAARFAGLYADSLNHRYRSLRLVSGAPPQVAEQQAPNLLNGNHEWLTEEGDVIIDAERDTVFISESLDDVTSARLKEAVFVAPKTAADGKSPFAAQPSRIQH
jgi:hypothetical protein